MSKPITVRLKVPRQELEQSSFFASEPAAAEAWVAQLPMANLGHTTREIFKALSELNRVRMPPDKRMAILEILRPPLYFASRGLSKHYLNQPITLPDQARKVADLANTLHRQLATGYTIVATHTAALGGRIGTGSPKELIAPALHRALTDHTVNLLRHYQLYEPVQEGNWNSIHQFYLLASQQGLLDQEVADPQYSTCTLRSCYIRALLLGCSKPNQLRQRDFSGMFATLSDWAKSCQIEPITPDRLFIIDLEADRSPVYQELVAVDDILHGISLNTSGLIRQLSAMRDRADPTELQVGKDYYLSLDLLNHLILSWGSVSKRNFMRIEANETLELAIGLSTTHHFICDGLSFEALIAERGTKAFAIQQDNPFMKVQNQIQRNKDIWDSAYASNVGQISLESIEYHIRDNEHKSTDKTPKYKSHNVQMLNSSANGYCIEWPPKAGAQVKTGEIIGLKEVASKTWRIAVIRWVSHNSEQQTQLGIELISPSAAPYGGRIVKKTGSEKEYVRVLVLPEITATGQPMTLLTPQVPFKAGNKVVLNQQGREIQLTLLEKINQTGSYNQFTFKRLGVTNASQGKDEDNNESGSFDSIWRNL